MAKSKLSVSRRKEIILLSTAGLIWLTGFVFCILGVYAYNGPGKLANNPIYQSQKAFGNWLGLAGMVDYRFFGTVICLIGMVLFLIIFYNYANKFDKINERKKRQAERLKSLVEEDEKAVSKLETAEEVK